MLAHRRGGDDACLQDLMAYVPPTNRVGPELATLPPDLERAIRFTDEADPGGEYFAPEVLAERLGFRGFSWKALTTGCRANGGDTQIYFSGPNVAAFRLEDFDVTMKRK